MQKYFQVFSLIFMNIPMKNGDRETLNAFINAPLKAPKASAIIKSVIPVIGRDVLDRRSLNIKTSGKTVH